MKRLPLVTLIIAAGIFYSFAGGDCPGKNTITVMRTDMSSFMDVSPLDFSQIFSGGAQLSRDGTKLTVSLSNMGGLTISQLVNDFVLPIKNKHEFIADIEFRNGKDSIKPGLYKGASGYGKPFWAFAEVKLHKGEKGVVVSLGIMEGEAEIINLSGDSVCGRFNLRSRKGSNPHSAFSGEFNVKLERSKW
jgi:hypothetical protein